ncbi:cell cycle and apoptosis regulator protein 2 [Quercus suber]|uniref:Cell cycle and apoptosis regulator protein 2 n=1 Tax=Quercus suber TaxID=58331 RepID=A0AAW0KUY4_QUESU
MESADGVDPSVDDTSSIHTVHRYAKDVTQLDLQNCHHWNRFLEIHYDSLGKDGLLSHKVTVLFVPDLSECLPSLDAWRDQWAMACSQEGCCRERAPTFFEKRGL